MIRIFSLVPSAFAWDQLRIPAEFPSFGFSFYIAILRLPFVYCIWMCKTHLENSETEGQIRFLVLQSRFLSFFLVPQLLPGTGLANQNRNPHVFSSVCVLFQLVGRFWLSYESLLKNTEVGSSYSSPQTYFVFSDCLSRLSVFWLPQLRSTILPEAGLLNQSSHRHLYHLMKSRVGSFDDCFRMWLLIPFLDSTIILSNRMKQSRLSESVVFSSWNHLIGIRFLGLPFFTSRKVEVVCFLLLLLPLLFEEVFDADPRFSLLCLYNSILYRTCQQV